MLTNRCSEKNIADYLMYLKHKKTNKLLNCFQTVELNLNMKQCIGDLCHLSFHKIRPALTLSSTYHKLNNPVCSIHQLIFLHIIQIKLPFVSKNCDLKTTSHYHVHYYNEGTL